MSRYLKQCVALTAVAAAIALCCASESLAKKPGGGGGGGGGPGQNGGGLIYFSYDYELYTMNDDGSGMAVVAGFPAGIANGYIQPSRQLHADKRWFAKWQGYHNISALSDAGDVVSLNIDPQLEYVHYEPIWSVGDGYLSWTGRRLDGSGAVLEGGIYTTELLFDTQGNVTGAGSTELLVSLPLVDQGGGFMEPDINRHDWSPDGTKLVYATWDGQMVIADLLTGALDEIASAGPMSDPQWSPAGDKLMVRYQTRGRSAVGVMNTDGSGMKLVEANGVSWYTNVGVWSPTGSHLVYLHGDNLYNDSYIARATSTGTGRSRLTDASMGSELWWAFGPRPLGWRDLGVGTGVSPAIAIPEPVSCVLLTVGLFTLLSVHQRSRSLVGKGRLLVLVLASIIFSPTLASAELVRWEAADGGNGHWYEVLTGPMSTLGVPSFISWTDASFDAEARGGYLATITSAAENEFVFNLIDSPAYWSTNQRGVYYGPWLGATQAPDAEEPGSGWFWVTGEPFEYTNWLPGEPNEWGGLDEDYLHFIGGEGAPSERSAFWNDESETLRNPIAYVVEYVPEPSGGLLTLSVMILCLLLRRTKKE